MLKYLNDEGRCNATEDMLLDPNWHFPTVVMIIGRRGTKCVDENTLCQTDRGLLSLKELSELQEKFRVPDGKGGTCEVESVYSNGEADTLVVTTDLGTEISGLPEHRVRVMFESGNVEWKYFRDLKEGDWVCHNRHPLTNVKPSNTYPIENYEMWGVYTGDGNVTESQRGITISIDARYELEERTKLMQRVFCETPKFTHAKRGNGGRLSICDISLRRFWKKLGFGYDLKEKGVPRIIREASLEQQAAYLRGLFDSDGFVGNRRIKVSMKSKKLASSVQLLLLNLGIASKLFESYVLYNGERRVYFNIEVKSNRDRLKFLEKVGFLGSRKKQRALVSCGVGDRECDIIPNQQDRVMRWYYSIKKLNPNVRDNRDWFRFGVNKREDLTWSNLKRMLETYFEDTVERRELKQLFEEDYIYSQVKSIKQTKCFTRDLVVPESKTYVASGMVTHNTTFCGWVAAYETYKLLRLKHPQKHYGISPDQSLGIVTVSTGKDLATELFQGMASILTRSTFFKPFLEADLRRSIRLKTRAAIEGEGSLRANIYLQAAVCSAKSLRGPQRLMGIFDEYGHFTVEMAGQDRSDRAVWDAVQPSTSDLTNPDGSPAGRMFAITTPLSRDTHAYQLLQLGMSDPKSGILCFQMPSVWINKNINKTILYQAYAENPEKAAQEYGAEFSDKVSAAFKNVDFQSSAREGPTILVKKQFTMFMGIDIGGMAGTANHDGTAWSICHVEGDKKICTYHEYWLDELDKIPQVERFQAVADHTVKLWREYDIHLGIYDQFNAYGFQNLLRVAGIKEWSGLRSDHMQGQYLINFTDTLNSQLAKYAIDIAEAGQCIVYGDDFIKELIQLQRYEVGTNRIKVCAPSIRHMHDDRWSAWSRALWAAKIYYDENPNRIKSGTRAGTYAPAISGMRSMAMRKLNRYKAGQFNPRTTDPRIVEKFTMQQRMRKVSPRVSK